MLKVRHWIYVILIIILSSCSQGDGKKELEAGLDAAEQGDYSTAIRYLNKAIDINPDAYDAYYNRAVVYGILGKNDKAISDCTKTIELNPIFYRVFANRGSLYGQNGQYDMAINDFTKAIEINPQLSPSIYRQLSVILELKRRGEEKG